MARKVLPLALLTASVFVPALGRAEPPLTLKSVNVELPDSGKTFPGSGADAINNNCLACHSSEMILNQPALPTSAWQAEVSKMIDVYKARVAPEDAAAVIDYLVRTKGEK